MSHTPTHGTKTQRDSERLMKFLEGPKKTAALVFKAPKKPKANVKMAKRLA